MTDSDGVARPHLRRSDLRRLREALAAGKTPDASPLTMAAAESAQPAADPASPEMTAGTILTVCTGNICRSPMAEVLLRSGLAGLPIRVHSAGTHALVDHEMTAPAQEIAVERGAGAAAAAAHRARLLTPEILAESDLVLAMSREHRSFVVQMAPALLHRTFTVREFARLAATLSDDELRAGLADAGADAGARLRALAGLVRAQRGLVVSAPEDDDVIDPYRRSRVTYERSAGELAPAVETAVHGIHAAFGRATLPATGRQPD